MQIVLKTIWKVKTIQLSFNLSSIQKNIYCAFSQLINLYFNFVYLCCCLTCFDSDRLSKKSLYIHKRLLGRAKNLKTDKVLVEKIIEVLFERGQIQNAALLSFTKAWYKKIHLEEEIVVIV